MPDDLGLDDQELSASDIAELAGVSPSAVSNWRKRHHDFPQPLDRPGRWLRFKKSEILDWLDGRADLARRPQRDLTFTDELLRCVDALRGDLAPQQALYVAARVHAAQLLALSGRESVLADLGPIDPDHQVVVLEGRLMAAKDLDEIAEAVDECLIARAGRANEAGMTRPELSRFLAQVLLGGAPDTADSQMEAYDPCAGVGGTLMALTELQPDLTLLGQELLPEHADLARLRAILRGKRIDLATGDSIAQDLHLERRSDYVIADPPLGLRISDRHADDPRWRLVDPGRDGTSAWIQIALSHLNETGRAVLTVEPSWASRSAGVVHVRSALARQNLVDAVISMPRGSVMGSWVEPLVIVLDRNREARPVPRAAGEILFIDLAEVAAEFDEGLMSACIDLITDWRWKREDSSGPGRVVRDLGDLSRVPGYDEMTRLVDAIEVAGGDARRLSELRGVIDVIWPGDGTGESNDDLSVVEVLDVVATDVCRGIVRAVSTEAKYETVATVDFDLTPRRHVPIARGTKRLEDVFEDVDQLHQEFREAAEGLVTDVVALTEMSTREAQGSPSFTSLRLGDLVAAGAVEVIEGLREKRRNLRDSRPGIPVLGHSCLADLAFLDEIQPVGWVDHEQVDQEQMCRWDDVVIGLLGENAGAAYRIMDEDEWCLGPGLAAVRLADPSAGLTAEYLALWFRTADCLDQIRRLTRGSSLRRLTARALLELSVPVPDAGYLTTHSRRSDHLVGCQVWMRDLRRGIERAVERETHALDAQLDEANGRVP